MLLRNILLGTFFMLAQSLSSASAMETDSVNSLQPFLQLSLRQEASVVQNDMVLTWATRVPSVGWVEYGTDSTHLSTVYRIEEGKVVANNRVHKIVISNLTPGQRYYYRVCSRVVRDFRYRHITLGDTVVSGFRSFVMPDLRANDFKIVVFNDIHRHEETISMLMKRVNDVHPDLILFNGDCLVEPDCEQDLVDMLSLLNSKVGADEIPVLYLRGNHETRGAYSWHLHEYLNFIDGSLYGAFSWGDTRFVLMDFGETRTDSNTQFAGLNRNDLFRAEGAEFLKKELQSPAFLKARKRVLVHHVPLYGYEGCDPLHDVWGRLLVNAPFNICLNADLHEYAYLPPEAGVHAFPVAIAGGEEPCIATVFVLSKKDSNLNLKAIKAEGGILLDINL